MKASNGTLFGIILIGIGVLLLLDNMYIVDFGEVMHTYWPVLIILLGLSLIVRRSSSRGGQGVPSEGLHEGSASDADRLSASMVFGDYNVTLRSKSFRGGNVSTTFGDIDLDLRDVQLAEGEQSLRLDGVFGDTMILLPRDVAFAVHSSTTFGDVSIHDQRRGGVSPSLDYASPDFATASRKLRVVVSRVFGSVTVSG